MTFRARHILLAMACVTAMHSLPLPAQSASLVSASDADASSSAAPVVMSTIPVVTPPATPKPLTARWLDLTTFSHSERYRNAFATGGWHVFENYQQRSLIEGDMKLDAEGRYRIGFRASSGRYFNWSYGSYTGQAFLSRVLSQGFVTSYFTPAAYQSFRKATQTDPVGTATAFAIKSNGWQFYMRELYFSAMPVQWVNVEFGSFSFERGLSTEITTYDEDGYLSGERIRIRKPQQLFFDEVGFTAAYFGDVATPNLFDRGSSLKKDNYRQLFANKQLFPRLGVSGEYTWLSGTDTVREAAVVHVPESRLIDSVRFEGYQRLNTVNLQGLNVEGGSGLAVAAQKRLGRLSGDAGFASIDRNYAVYADSRFFEAVSFSLVGDSYSDGKRGFVHASYRVNPKSSLRMDFLPAKLVPTCPTSTSRTTTPASYST